MGFFDNIFSFNKRKERKNGLRYAKMMSGALPVFSSFGTDVYASDIVQNAVRRVCKQMAKLHPRHIVSDNDGMVRTKYGSDLNRLLKFGPNPLMSTSDFLSRITYQYETKKNVYILPTWERIPVGNDGKYKRRYTGLWPLNPQNVDFMCDDNGVLYISFAFASSPGEWFTYRYGDIIHWRKDYTESDFFGGGINGEPANTAKLKLLEADSNATQAISNGILNSNAIYGIIKQNSLMDDGTLKDKQEEFEKRIKDKKSGFLIMDLKEDFQQVTIDPKIIASDVSEKVVQRILAEYSMSLDIYNGEFDEEGYQAWYESYLEDLIVALGQEFSRKLFTERELEVGNEISFYQSGLQYMNTSNKVNVATILTNIGFLTDNQIGQIFGYEPFEGGNVRHQSLNYIDREIANQYQMANMEKVSDKDA